MSLRIDVVSTIAGVSASEWNSLLTEASTPFVDHRFLSALEESGCASAAHGWTPVHLTARAGGRLVGAAPAYVKDDSDGDFARDWDFGSAAARVGLRYYPKLVMGVPFTPCTGERLLLAPGPDAGDVRTALVAAAAELAKRNRLGTVQVLFPNLTQAEELEAAGQARRVSYQFHWRNEGYRDYADFLSRFTSKRRAMLRRERAEAEKQGIAVRTVRGAELGADPGRFAKLAHDLHRATVDKLMWGRRWLNGDFYTRVFTAMPEHVELVVAERGSKVVAGAFNIRGGQRLYGRYWGCFEDHPFLHFNVCYYHSIDECIAQGLSAFEGGAGGEHKLARGFLPAETYSTHLFLDGQLDHALREYLERETPERERAVAAWRQEASGFRKAETN